MAVASSIDVGADPASVWPQDRRPSPSRSASAGYLSPLPHRSELLRVKPHRRPARFSRLGPPVFGWFVLPRSRHWLSWLGPPRVAGRPLLPPVCAFHARWNDDPCRDGAPGCDRPLATVRAFVRSALAVARTDGSLKSPLCVSIPRAPSRASVLRGLPFAVARSSERSVVRS